MVSFKRVFKVFILLLSVFFIITVLSEKAESMNDGNDTYGFPFTFYTYLGGKRIPEPPSREIYNYMNLLIDIAFASLVAFGNSFIFNLVKRRMDFKRKIK